MFILKHCIFDIVLFYVLKFSNSFESPFGYMQIMCLLPNGKLNKLNYRANIAAWLFLGLAFQALWPNVNICYASICFQIQYLDISKLNGMGHQKEINCIRLESAHYFG